MQKIKDLRSYIVKNSTAPKVNDFKNFEEFHKADKEWISKNRKRLY